MRLLVTGATGFIGKAVLAESVLNPGWRVRGASRRAVVNLPAGVEAVVSHDLAPDTDWCEALNDIDVIVHTAARVHVMHDSAPDPLAEFRRVNVAGTLNLASQAAGSGARRFVFISSIKVNGEWTRPGQPFTADDIPSPLDAYGISKFEAEQGLRKIARETGLEVVIIRPVLVYGPGVKANFLRLMDYIYRGVPLPLGAIHNRRSLLALANLVDLVLICVQHPAAANQVFLASDGEDLSTTQLLRRLGAALGKPARLLPVPAGVLKAAAALLGKKAMADRLLGSLQVDISNTHSVLQWTPPASVDDVLRITADDYIKRRQQALS